MRQNQKPELPIRVQNVDLGDRDVQILISAARNSLSKVVVLLPGLSPSELALVVEQAKLSLNPEPCLKPQTHRDP